MSANHSAADTTVVSALLATCTLAEALRRWGDPVALKAMDELNEYSVRPIAYVLSDGVNHYLDMHHRFAERRTLAFAPVLQRLKAGKLILSGFIVPLGPTSHRETVNPELFELLFWDFEKSEVRGPGFHLVKVEIAETRGEELRLPARAANDDDERIGPASCDSPAEFWANPDYSKVRIREHHFTLSGLQCQVVHRLYDASLTSNPWLNGKRLLAEAGYQITSLGDAFRRHEDPSWRELIKTDGRGSYRLNIRKSQY